MHYQKNPNQIRDVIIAEVKNLSLAFLSSKEMRYNPSYCRKH
ncbi:MAG: hypothetical protein ACTSRI_16960 [Promethearchaeota archaeon]